MDQASGNLVERFARKAVALLDEYEFRSFWLGVRIGGPVAEEDAIAFKKNLNRRVGLRVLELEPDLDATLTEPEVRIILDCTNESVEIRVRPLLIYGRYRKLSREIPQSKWPCRYCRGQGCERCAGIGRRFIRTVEELVAAPLLAASGAQGTKLHSVGREDVDARMLGRGRPFVLSLANPRKRTIALEGVADQLNRELSGEVEVRELQFADKALLKAVTSINPDKSYRASVACLAPIRIERILPLGDLRHVIVRQETPRRVLHRRANRVRHREIRACTVNIPDEPGALPHFDITLRVESGTYIKEFVSGDEGRSTPSVAELLGVPCDCVVLDVLEVHCDPIDDLT